MIKDSQKKSKRKGRNKQEVMPVSQTEPEAEEVKTPIDMKRVSTHGHSPSSSSHLLQFGSSVIVKSITHKVQLNNFKHTYMFFLFFVRV